MLLAIDTSTGTSVAVVDRDRASGELRCLFETGTDDTMRHAEVIGGFIRDALEGAGVARDRLSGVAAGMGPGPFTGLRVGIAAAHAFALGIDRPFVPVVSHDAIALSRYRAGDTGPVQVVTDARRREFAYTLYRGIDDDGLPIRVAEPALTPRDDLDDLLADAAAARRDADRIPAAMLALAAARALAAGRTIGPADALYLRSPDVTLPHAPKRVGS